MRCKALEGVWLTCTVPFTLTPPCLLPAFGANGDVVCVLPVGSFAGHVCPLTAAQLTALRAGGLYFNVHTTANAAGGEFQSLPLSPLQDDVRSSFSRCPRPLLVLPEIRGQIRFCDVSATRTRRGYVDLSGAQQVPTAVLSTARGRGDVTLLADGSGVSVSLSLINLTGQTAAHIHAGGPYTACMC